jgi:glycosyltransferase involved in cell wall biosynthesis
VKVSVIVPVYNTPKEMIEECLKSVTGQDYKDIELLVIRDEGTGAAKARNKGLEKATGEYVCFVDSDDYLSPGAISLMVEAIGDADMVIGGFRKFGNFETVVSEPRRVKWSKTDLAYYALGNMQRPMSNQLLSGCWAKLYRRDKVGSFPEISTAEDMAFNFDYFRSCKHVEVIPDIVYHNRKRNGSLTTTFDLTDKYGLFGFLVGLRYARRFLREECDWPDSEVEMAIDNSRVYHSMLYFMRICEHTGKPMREVFKDLYQ